MKSITIRQPYASAIMLGLKPYEIRKRPTKHRGGLVVHAAANARANYQFWCNLTSDQNTELVNALAVKGWRGDTFGAGLGIVRLVDCIPTADLPTLTALQQVLCPLEYGNWAYVLEVVDVWEKPLPAKGQLGLWEWNRAAGESGAK